MSKQSSGSNSEMSHPEESSANDWQPCAAGEVAGMVQRVQRRRRAATVARATSVAACLLAGIAILQLEPFGKAGGPPGGITCRETLQRQSEFQAGELEGEEIAEQIREHLAGCPRCAEKFRSRSPQASEDVPTGPAVVGSWELNPRLIAAEF